LCTPVALCNFNIGVDSTPLYILGGISYTGLGQKVYSCPISPPGGTTTPIFSTALLQLSATDLAAGSQTIWFATANTQFSPPSRGLSEYFPSTQSVVSAGSFTSANYVATAVDPSTGILFQAYTDSIYAVAAVAPEPDAGQHSQLCQYGLDNVVEIAAGGGKLIVSDNQTGTITGSTVSANDVCDTAATLATGEPAVSALATNGTIFTFNDGTSVFACDATLGCLPSASPTPIAKSQGSVSAIAIDGASPPNLYWVGSQGLVSCSSSASACNDSPTTLIPNATPTAGIVVDDTYVYYTQNTTLYRVVH
jgi:hypothetical protein